MTQRHSTLAKASNVANLRQLYFQSRSFKDTEFLKGIFAGRLGYLQRAQIELERLATIKDPPTDEEITATLNVLLDLGLPQRYLAQRLQTSTSAINRWINGSNPPRPIVRNMIVIEAKRIFEELIEISMENSA